MDKGTVNKLPAAEGLSPILGTRANLHLPFQYKVNFKYWWVSEDNPGTTH